MEWSDRIFRNYIFSNVISQGCYGSDIPKKILFISWQWNIIIYIISEDCPNFDLKGFSIIKIESTDIFIFNTNKSVLKVFFQAKKKNKKEKNLLLNTFKQKKYYVTYIVIAKKFCIKYIFF